MSIHPEYADAILDGRKTVEFRKRPIGDDVSHVIIYATSPVSAVVGAFEVTGQDTASPRTLWDKFARVAGISRRKYFAYYTGRRQGTGIRVGEVMVTQEHLSLSACLGVSHPPQSYRYLPDDAASAALEKMVPASLAICGLID